ncbi:NACHT domain-containing protein [Streptomyces nojiriensis]|uniref:NACHT domain-containing protein n=1 Tax=Streptomyces nojiriensis TaxID=66374 RepID=UPI0035DEA978
MSPQTPLPLAKLGVKKSAFSAWQGGINVPSLTTLDSFLAKLKPHVGYNTWQAADIAKFDFLVRELRVIAGIRENPGYSAYTTLRRLSRDAWHDANQIIKPDRGLFPEGIELQNLYVPRSQEQDIVDTALGTAGAQLIAGEAGCGKTTLLWSIYRTLDRSDSIEPLLVKASHLIAAFRADVTDRSSAVRVEDIAAAARCCRAVGHSPVVLVDTLDLLAQSQEGRTVVSRLLGTLRRLQVPAVLTCRPGEAALLRFPGEPDGDAEPQREAVDDLGGYLRPQRILGWYDEDERRAAIHSHAQVYCPDWKYGPGAAEKLETDVLGAVYQGLPLREVCDNPLYLRLLFDLYAPAPPLQDVDVAGLFDRVRDMRIKRDARPGNGEDGSADRDLSHTTQALARYMLAANTIEYLPRDAGDTLLRLLPGTTPETIDSDLRELHHRGMIAHVPGTGSIRFFHQTFFEYMAAEYLRIAGRGSELVDRMLEQPEDLVLAAVAGQLIPRADRGTDEQLLTPLFTDKRLAGRALELYAQVRDPGTITATAHRTMASTPPVTLRRFLHLLPGHAHRAGSARWTADLATIWTLTADHPTVRYQLFAAVRRLAQQHGPAAVDFCHTEDRLSWWLSLGPERLATQKNDWLALLRALLRHDPTQTLAWTAQACGPLLAAGTNGVVAETVHLVREEIERIPHAARRKRGRERALHRFEKLLNDREGKDHKSLLQVEQAVGRLWAECQQCPDEEQLISLFTTTLKEAGQGPTQAARLFGAGFLAAKLSPSGARTAMTHLLALSAPAVQTRALNHILVPSLQGEPTPLRDELENACRTAAAALPSRPYEADGRRATASWLTDAVAESGIGGDRLTTLLPDTAPPQLWLITEGLASLVGDAAANQNESALAAVRDWADGKLSGDADVTASATTVRKSLKKRLGDSADVLKALVQDSARRGPNALTDLLTEATRTGRALDTEAVRDQIEAQLASTSTPLAHRLNLWRLVIARCAHQPPAAVHTAALLAEATAGTTDHSVILGLIETAAEHPDWTWENTAELRKQLRVATKGQSGNRKKGAPSPDRALSTLLVHLAPLRTAGQRAEAVESVMDLALPAEDLTTTDVQHARTLPDLLRKVAAVSTQDAAEALITAAARLHAHPNSVAEDLGKHTVDIMSTILAGSDPTEQKDLITTLAKSDAAIATAAIGAFAFLTEDRSQSQPPEWFRALGHDLRIDPRIRNQVNGRLTIQARVRCGGPWPELLQEASLRPASPPTVCT